MVSSFSLPTMSLFQAKLLSPRNAIRAQTSLNGEKKMRVPFELKQGKRHLFHELPSGLNMEVLLYRREISPMRKARTMAEPHHLFLFTEATMLLGAGLSIGCLSFHLLDMIAMLSACWARAKVMHPPVLLPVLFSRNMQAMLPTSSIKNLGCHQY